MFAKLFFVDKHTIIGMFKAVKNNHGSRNSTYISEIFCRTKLWNKHIGAHTSSVKRFSENFDQEAVTYLIFFV